MDTTSTPNSRLEKDRAYRAANREHFSAYQKAYYRRNRAKKLAASKVWKEANRDKSREHARMRNSSRLGWSAQLKKKYGIDADRFEEMEAEQGGLCAVCGEKPPHRLHVDHCHSTYKVRGLLCGHCNRAMGLLRDRPAVARAAARYLEQRG
jgi:formate dehydrogenase maturation protein FdhE